MEAVQHFFIVGTDSVEKMKGIFPGQPNKAGCREGAGSIAAASDADFPGTFSSLLAKAGKTEPAAEKIGSGDEKASGDGAVPGESFILGSSFFRTCCFFGENMESAELSETELAADDSPGAVPRSSAEEGLSETGEAFRNGGQVLIAAAEGFRPMLRTVESGSFGKEKPETEIGGKRIGKGSDVFLPGKPDGGTAVSSENSGSAPGQNVLFVSDVDIDAAMCKSFSAAGADIGKLSREKVSVVFSEEKPRIIPGLPEGRVRLFAEGLRSEGTGSPSGTFPGTSVSEAVNIDHYTENVSMDFPEMKFSRTASSESAVRDSEFTAEISVMDSGAGGGAETLKQSQGTGQVFFGGDTADADIPGQIFRAFDLSQVKRGRKNLEVSLSPAKLGRLKISIEVNDKGMTVRLHAEKTETAGLLQGHLNDLRQSLEQKGITVRDMSVQDYGFGNGRGGSGKEKEHRYSHAGFSADVFVGEDCSESVQMRDNTILNMLA